jgi:hypothetical protein
MSALFVLLSTNAIVFGTFKELQGKEPRRSVWSKCSYMKRAQLWMSNQRTQLENHITKGACPKQQVGFVVNDFV